MDVTSLTFELKDVILISGGIITFAGFLFPLLITSKQNTKDLTQHKVDYMSNMLSLRSEVETRLSHSKNEIKSDISSIYDEINQNKTEMIAMIKDVKRETKEEYSKLSTQISSMNIQVTNFGSEISRLNGYLKAQQENKLNKNQ